MALSGFDATFLSPWSLKLKVKAMILTGNPMTELRVSLAVVLLAARHKRTHPALTPASKTGTWFTYPGGMEGWVHLDDFITPVGVTVNALKILRGPPLSLFPSSPSPRDCVAVIAGVQRIGGPLKVKYWGVWTPVTPAALTPMNLRPRRQSNPQSLDRKCDAITAGLFLHWHSSVQVVALYSSILIMDKVCLEKITKDKGWPTAYDAM